MNISISFGQNCQNFINGSIYKIVPSNSIKKCFAFKSNSDKVEFKFQSFSNVLNSPCENLTNKYTLLSEHYQKLDSNSTGIFKNLTKNNNYIICYESKCSLGKIGILLTSEVRSSPIELSSFWLSVNKNTVLVNWTSKNELESEVFTLFSSNDLQNWSNIGTIDGSGTTSWDINYSYTHVNPTKGVNFYVLKHTDSNGDIRTFGPISCKFKVKK